MSLPPTAAAFPVAEAEWSTGLFDCYSNYKNCLITCMCPCITFGQIAEIVDKGSTSCRDGGALFALSYLFGCAGSYSSSYRAKLREQYMLKESPLPDILVHCLCGSCALCQEYRELENRGFDMAIGWEGKNQGVGMAPTAPAVKPMTR